jgi:hypothetical protein
MRFCWQAFAVAIVVFANPLAAEPVYDINMYALMPGKCGTLRIAEIDYRCKIVAYFHSERGRADYTIVLDDPADESHIISFSGENARRDEERYELSIDRMLTKIQTRTEGRWPTRSAIEISEGTCTQIGSFTKKQISSVACIATTNDGKEYELQFESDGLPIEVRKLRQAPLPTEKRRTHEIAQLECRLKAELEKVMRRDRAAYIIRCLEESQESTANDPPQ